MDMPIRTDQSVLVGMLAEKIKLQHKELCKIVREQNDTINKLIKALIELEKN